MARAMLVTRSREVIDMQYDAIDDDDERARARAGAPLEWLLSVLSERDGHRRLLEESGSLALAAFRLAWARCKTSAHPSDVPSVHELRGAAREIARRTGRREQVPSVDVLVHECEAAGLLVI